MRVRDVIFSMAVILLLISPALLFCAQRATPASLPSWLTTEDAAYLSGETPWSRPEADLSLGSFQDKSLQGSIEKGVANYIPLKGKALLGYAGLQRSFIEASNGVFGWDCYPTFYGSTRLYAPGMNALTYLPKEATSFVMDGLKAFGEQLEQLACEYPDKRFVVYLVCGYESPSLNPAYQYVNDPLTVELTASVLDDYLSDEGNVEVIYQMYEDYDSYYDEFYRTDHHWNAKGAARAYGDLAQVLGWEAHDDGTTVGFDDYSFVGTTSRGALFDLGEPVDDIRYDFSCLSVLGKDGIVGSVKPLGLESFSDAAKKHSFYDAQYAIEGFEEGDAILCDRKDAQGHRALLVTNSFGNAVQRLMAREYEQTRISKALFGPLPDTKSLRFWLEEDDPDDVVFLAHPSSYARIIGDIPGYLD